MVCVGRVWVWAWGGVGRGGGGDGARALGIGGEHVACEVVMSAPWRLDRAAAWLYSDLEANISPSCQRWSN